MIIESTVGNKLHVTCIHVWSNVVVNRAKMVNGQVPRCLKEKIKGNLSEIQSRLTAIVPQKLIVKRQWRLRSDFRVPVVQCAEDVDGREEFQWVAARSQVVAELEGVGSVVGISQARIGPCIIATRMWQRKFRDGFQKGYLNPVGGLQYD